MQQGTLGRCFLGEKPGCAELKSEAVIQKFLLLKLKKTTVDSPLPELAGSIPVPVFSAVQQCIPFIAVLLTITVMPKLS